MKQEYVKKLHLPLNIQMFAEEGNDGNGGGVATPTPKTYTEDEYNKLKTRIDEMAKNEKAYKEKIKASQTEEEQKAQAQKEKDDLLASLQRENTSMKIAKELAVGGFTETDIESITRDIVEGNMENLTKTLVNIRKAMQEEITKQAKQEFQKSNKLPNGGGSTDEDNSIGTRLGKNNASTNKAREFYANRK